MSRPIVLTTDERAKFAAYLHQEADADARLSKEGEKVGIPEPVLKRLRTRAMAKKLVAEDIEGWEEQRVGGQA